MKKKRKEIIGWAICIAVVMLLASVITHQLWMDDIRFKTAKADFETGLSEYVELERGIVDSPSVIIVVSSKEAFLNKVQELGASAVYHSGTSYSSSYYVFRDDYQIAWKYQFSLEDE